MVTTIACSMLCVKTTTSYVVQPPKFEVQIYLCIARELDKHRKAQEKYMEVDVQNHFWMEQNHTFFYQNFNVIFCECRMIAIPVTTPMYPVVMIKPPQGGTASVSIDMFTTPVKIFACNQSNMRVS